MSPAVLMAIQPRFAQAVFDRRKLFEYRRRRMGIVPGTTVFLYESAPTSAIVGEFTSGHLRAGDAIRLEEMERDNEMRALVRAYIDGAKVASAIEIVAPRRWNVPVRLESLGICAAPMSYGFITEEIVGRIRNMQG